MIFLRQTKFAILGAGAGGQSMAAILAEKGYSIKLYDNNAEKINKLNKIRTIKVTGAIEASGFPEVVTNDIAEVMKDIDVVMVVTTTDAHKEIAKGIATYLKDGQIILLNPGHVLGALEFSQILFEGYGLKKKLIIGETADLMYACRIIEIGKPFHSGIKKTVGVATLPACDVDELLRILRPVFPNLVPMKNIFDTSFSGAGAMLHPIPSFMNINKIDSNQAFDYYMEGITTNIAKLVSAADRERLSVCGALGIDVPSLVDTLKKMYNLPYEDLYELIQHNKAYEGVKSPSSIEHRFMVEDVVCGLVPLASIGHEFGLETPIMDAFIEIASIISGKDYWVEGRTVEKLGLKGKTLEELYDMIS